LLGELPLAAAREIPAEVFARLREGASPEDRLEAIRQLRADAGSRSRHALAAAMREDLNDRVRQAAALALLDAPDGQTIQDLDEFLSQEQGEEVRRAVCVALSSAPADNSGAISLLGGRLLQDGSGAVRLAAVESLRARGDRRALGDLKIAAQKDADPAVRRQAQAAWKILNQPAPKPKAMKTKAAPVQGPCQCSRGPMKLRARQTTREECEHSFRNSYQRQGFSCSWNSMQLE